MKSSAWGWVCQCGHEKWGYTTWGGAHRGARRHGHGTHAYAVQQSHSQPREPWQMTYEEYRKRFPATRCFSRFDHNQRADMRASHRLGHRQRERTGEFYYTHPDAPGLCFETHGMAVRAGHFNRIRTAIKEGKDVPLDLVAELPEVKFPAAR